jgi:hypothetical protein
MMVYTNKGFLSIYKHQHCKPKKMDFSLGNLTLVSFGCVVFGGSFQMVIMLIGHCHVDEEACVWGLDILPKEECMSNGFYFV